MEGRRIESILLGGNITNPTIHVMTMQSNADYLSASKAWETDQTVIYLKKLSVLERVDDDEIERVKGIVASNAVSNNVNITTVYSWATPSSSKLLEGVNSSTCCGNH